MKQSNIWLSADGIEPPHQNNKRRKKRHHPQKAAPVDYTCRAAYHYSVNDFRYNCNRSTVDVLTGQ